MESKVILGLDPGSTQLGFGLIKSFAQQGQLALVDYGVVKMNAKTAHMQRMHHLYAHIYGLLEQYKPEEVAIESVFCGSNVQAMLKLGRSQGIAIAAALAQSLPVAEYAPCKVKQAVTGKGRGSKQQVAAMVGQLLHIAPPKVFDASDALAVAICHSQQHQTARPSVQNWSSFVQKNANRVIGAV